MRLWRVAAGLLALVVAGQAHVSGPWSRTGTYTVRRGESLYEVARRTDVPLRDLAQANRISNVHHLRVGQVLVIPPEKNRRAERSRSSERSKPAPRASAPPLSSRVVVARGATGRGWLCPVQGRRVDFADGWGHPRPGGRRHVGTDLFAFRGTPVVASVSGRLEHAPGRLAGLGYRLRGDDGITYVGTHLHSLVARQGRIKRGQLIGTVGSTGNAMGMTPHLHFEMHPGRGGPVNPIYTLRRWC